MKQLIFTAAFAVMVTSAQNTKSDPKANAAPVTEPAKSEAPPLERLITSDESKDLQITFLRVRIINDTYKMAEYQKAVQPWSEKQQALRESLCASVGVSKDQITASYPDGRPICVITGFDGNGEPIVGADGKPMLQKVIHQKPAEAPAR